MQRFLKISVVTINYNNAAGLDATIRSVLQQAYPSIEYLVIDGGSSDNSVDIIKSHQESISVWLSEKDKGVYNAMNKAIALATGDYLIFLNSGDSFADAESLNTLYQGDNNEDFIYGNLLVEEVGNTWLKTYPSKLTFLHFTKDSLPHPATLIKRNLFSRYGSYNESNRIVSDWEFFMLCICKHSCTYRHVDKTVAVFDFGGLSSRAESHPVIIAERQAILQKHFSSFLPDYDFFHLQQVELSSFKYALKRVTKLAYSKTKAKLFPATKT